MRAGYIGSAILHVAALALALVGVPWDSSEPIDSLDIIPVELVNLEEFSSAPEPQAALEPERAEPVTERRIEAPRQADSVVPPTAVAAPRTKPSPPRKRLTARLAPRSKPTPPKRYDRQRIAALLDKRQAETRSRSDQAEPKIKVTDKSDIRLRLANLDRRRLTASLRDAMRVQIERCWIIPAGARDAADLAIKIRVFLNPDGSLARPPEIVDKKRMFVEGQEFYRVAAEGARRAVQKCAPLDLPVEHYEIWRVSELIFDPGKMVGG